jgi:hypothetical protein
MLNQTSEVGDWERRDSPDVKLSYMLGKFVSEFWCDALQSHEV